MPAHGQLIYVYGNFIVNLVLAMADSEIATLARKRRLFTKINAFSGGSQLAPGKVAPIDNEPRRREGG